MRDAAASRGQVDVVIPTYNHRDGLLECLAHLDDDVIADRIVVDDASSDGTPEAVRGSFPDVTVHELEQHLGIAHAVNAGAALGSAPFILLLNDDAVAEAGSVARLLAELRRRPDATSAAGRLVDATTGETQGRYRPRHFPTLRTLLVRLLGIERLKPDNIWSGQHLREPLPEDAVVSVRQQPAGACHLIRRELFEELGGWDEAYWFMYEDTDFCVRLAEYGPVVWVGPATFRHVGATTSAQWARHQLHARLHHGTLRYAQTHFSRLRAGIVASVVMAASLLRLFSSLRDSEATAVYRRLIRESAAVLGGRPVELAVPPSEARRRQAEERDATSFVAPRS
jgi:N-acetylglucosaminyl-diphospho-decaprenol L-rhamnosyltransferase